MEWRLRGLQRARRRQRVFRPTETPGVAGLGARLEERTLLAALPSGFTESVVASGFNYPSSMTIAPDGRILVTEGPGKISVIKDGRVLPTPFANIAADATVSQGLMSIAFDPKFPVKPFVYAYYVSVDGGMHNRLSRLTVAGDEVLPGSEKVLYKSERFTIPPGQPAHNGGAIAFGRDGKIYVATGDMRDPKHAQQLTNTFGKILRLNPDGSIPKDNPFYKRTRGLGRAIWAYGLRNPFTITFQPGAARLYINDVGGASYEELNQGFRGANYGWPQVEGPTKLRGLKPPIYGYGHGQPAQREDAAIIGGAFYNPAKATFPAEYVGKYFFSDYAQGFLRTIDPVTRAVSTFGTNLGQGVVDIDLDAEGRLYYLTINDGAVHVIQYSPEQPPSLGQPLVDQVVPKGEAATLTASAQGTFPFTYQWHMNNQEIVGATAPELTIAASELDATARYRVTISNAFGSFTSGEVSARTTDDFRPTARILSPGATARPRIGQTLSFTGQGLDAEAPNGLLPASQLTWRLELLHNGHVHPNTYVLQGRDAGSFKIPGHDEAGEFALRLTLVVQDNLGQANESSVVIQPAQAAVKRRRRK